MATYRCTAAEVYTACGQPSTIDASLAQESANAITNSLPTSSAMTTELLRLVELYLSCHFLMLQTQPGPLQEDKVGEALQRYHPIFSKGLSATVYGQQAMMLDSTGTLAAMTSNVIKPNLPALFTTVGSQPPGVPDGQYGWNDPATLGSDWYP